MAAIPVYFGGDDRPLFGWLHVPETGRGRSGVVICPPVGLEYMQAHCALRFLADELMARGICVLRFDYDGTGDSAGNTGDPDRVEAWLASIGAAAAYLRSRGMNRVGAIGMRIGATLAGVAAERDSSFDFLVLWDPVAGKQFLAHQRALGALTAAAEDSTVADAGSIEAPGMVFGPDTVTDLRKLDLARGDGLLGRRVSVVVRPGSAGGYERLRACLAGAEWSEASGQHELISVTSSERELPNRTITSIAEWVSSVSPSQDRVIDIPPPAGPTRLGSLHGPGVVETPEFVGPTGLFAVRTEPGASVAPRRGPVIVFVNVATEHHVGPGRLWVELARRWAAMGRTSVRVDLSGLGDSPTRNRAQIPLVMRAPEAFDDLYDVCRHVAPDDPSDVVLIGLCSGAYQSLDSAMSLRPRGVVAVNPALSFEPPEVIGGARMDPRRQIALPMTAVMRAFRDERALSPLRRMSPDLAWSIRSKMKPGRRPGVWLAGLVDGGTSVVLICGPDEARPILAGASRRVLGRLSRTGRLHVAVIPGLHHALLVSSHRRDVASMITEHVLEGIGADRQALGEDSVRSSGATAPLDLSRTA